VQFPREATPIPADGKPGQERGRFSEIEKQT